MEYTIVVEDWSHVLPEWRGDNLSRPILDFECENKEVYDNILTFLRIYYSASNYRVIGSHE